MVVPSPTRVVSVSAATLAVVAIAAWGIHLRLVDPLSNGIVPAEDPYTHMSLVREHLRTGTIQPAYQGAGLYPPGMHALMASAWILTGVDLYQLFLVAPALFGAIGIAGVALILGRLAGPAGAVVGALAYALAPEIIFRTSMMAPTAVDLALLPFFLLCLLEVIRGRRAWTLPAAVLALFFLFSHPWVLLVLGAAGGVFILLTLVLPWPADRGPSIEPIGIATVCAILGGSLALAMTGCGGACGPGAANVVQGGDRLNDLAPFVVGLALLPFAILVVRRDGLDWLRPRGQRTLRPNALRVLFSVALVALLVVFSVPAYARGLPQFVDPSAMFGTAILILAAMALVALPFIASPAANLGAAIFVIAYPFTIYNPLHSDYWPHRTAAYLGLGLAILAGSLAQQVFQLAARAFARAAPRFGPVPQGASPNYAVVPGVIVIVAIAAGLFGATPGPYEGGWYRLYDACQMDALRHTADIVNASPRTIVVTGDWQAKLVLGAFVDGGGRNWLKRPFFTTAQSRDQDLAYGASDHHQFVAVIDPHLGIQASNLTFFTKSPWRLAGPVCHEPGANALTVYTTGANA